MIGKFHRGYRPISSVAPLIKDIRKVFFFKWHHVLLKCTSHYTVLVNKTVAVRTARNRLHSYWRFVVVRFYDTFFNILGHQRRFRHRAWKVRQILLRGSNFGLRFFHVPQIYDARPKALLPFRRKSYSGFLRSEKIHRPRPGSNPRTSDPEASMITTGPPVLTVIEEI